jgi:hypothetical protein
VRSRVGSIGRSVTLVQVVSVCLSRQLLARCPAQCRTAGHSSALEQSSDMLMTIGNKMLGMSTLLECSVLPCRLELLGTSAAGREGRAGTSSKPLTAHSGCQLSPQLPTLPGVGATAGDEFRLGQPQLALWRFQLIACLQHVTRRGCADDSTRRDLISVQKKQVDKATWNLKVWSAGAVRNSRRQRSRKGTNRPKALV